MADQVDPNTVDISIESLPLPSLIEIPNHGQLPSLSTVNGGDIIDPLILNPLPPPVPIDTYSIEYGPASTTEPQLDSPRGSPPPMDGEIPSFDELDDQYNFLRRTLSHSQRRYSARYKRPRPRPQSGNNEDEQSSLDMPGQGRDPNSEIPHRIKPPPYSRPHPLQKHHTVRGTSAHTDYMRQRQAQRRSGPATVKSTHVDSLGRSYVLDHNTHTVQYESPLAGPENVPEVRGRREMLNRRYESTQRSFRSAHRQRRVQTAHHHLSLIESVGTISYQPTDVEHSGSLGNNAATPPVSRDKKGRKSDKKNRWFGFSRKSKSSITQSPSGLNAQDNIIPIETSPDILSPITPPPSLDELEISLPPPPILDSLTYSDQNRQSEEREMVGSLEMETEQERNGNQDERNGTSDRVTAILEAINRSDSQSRPQSNVTPSDEDTQPMSPVHRATDLDRVKAVQAHRKISAARRNRTPAQHERDGDTDEETDVQSPRLSVASGDTPSHDQSQEVDTGDREEGTVSESKQEEEQEQKVEEEEVKEEEEEEEQQQRVKSQRIGSRKKLSKGLKECPALKFITRPDLYTFLSSSGEPGEAFFSNKSLVELVQRIRGQNDLFEKYQHSRHLVKMLNRFADQNMEIPDEWEKKLNKQGRIFFIDHNNRITTFIDPRLPLTNEDSNKPVATPLQVPQSVRRVYSTSDEPEVRTHHSTVVQSVSLPDDPVMASAENIQTEMDQTTYEVQIVAFLRQPDIVEKINQRYRRGVKPHLGEAIEDIRQNGVPGLERIQLAGGTAAYELGLILSLFDEEVNSVRPQSNNTPQIRVDTPASPESSPAHSNSPSTLQRQKQAFSAKLQTFKLQLARLGFAQSSRLKFNIRRDHLLEDAYEHMMKSEVRYLQRKRLNITFRGEEGLDYGGPSREFFFLVSREVFNPYFGLFEYSANDTYTVQISPTACFIRNNLDWFRFAGRIIGLVIAQGFLLDVFFTRPFYKMLLKRPPTLKDLESLEPAFYSSLLWIRDNDPAPLDLTFTVEEEAFGQLTTHELKEGGTDIPVLDDNKKEYIDMMLKWRLDRGTQEQSNALLKGFNEIMPVSLVQQFDGQELEFIIAGTLEIDIDDWRNNSDYRNGYHANHPVIQWFWRAVEMFDNEQRLRLLQFITGTSSVPYEGFKALRGSSGPKRFTIDYFNDVRSLPRSHTCFNRLDLPPYPSFEILYEKLRVAVEEGGTFGIE